LVRQIRGGKSGHPKLNGIKQLILLSGKEYLRFDELIFIIVRQGVISGKAVKLKGPQKITANI